MLNTTAVDWPDYFALLLMLISWVGYTLFSNWHSRRHACLATVLFMYRKHWLERMLGRVNRIADANLLGQLKQSVSFFASTSILIIAGLVTGIASSEKGAVILSHLLLQETTPSELWEFKMMVMVIIFMYSFFEFSWSLRLYNFCAVLMGSAPTPEESKASSSCSCAFSERGAQAFSLAAKHFNFGLRAYYFGLATLAWFVSVWLYIAMTFLVLFILYRREFHSLALKTLMSTPA